MVIAGVQVSLSSWRRTHFHVLSPALTSSFYWHSIFCSKFIFSQIFFFIVEIDFFFCVFIFTRNQWFWIIYVCVISSNSEIESKSAGVSGYGGLSSLSRLICLKSYLSVRTSALLQFWNFLLRRIIRSLLIGCFLGSFDMLIESSCH